MSSARKLTARERQTYLRLLARTRPCWGRILLAVVFGILYLACIYTLYSVL